MSRVNQASHFAGIGLDFVARSSCSPSSLNPHKFTAITLQLHNQSRQKKGGNQKQTVGIGLEFIARSSPSTSSLTPKNSHQLPTANLGNKKNKKKLGDYVISNIIATNINLRLMHSLPKIITNIFGFRNPSINKVCSTELWAKAKVIPKQAAGMSCRNGLLLLIPTVVVSRLTKKLPPKLLQATRNRSPSHSKKKAEGPCPLDEFYWPPVDEFKLHAFDGWLKDGFLLYPKITPTGGKKPGDPFDVIYVRNLPEQEHGDCGFHIVTYAEYFISGDHVPSEKFDAKLHRKCLTCIFVEPRDDESP